MVRTVAETSSIGIETIDESRHKIKQAQFLSKNFLKQTFFRLNHTMKAVNILLILFPALVDGFAPQFTTHRRPTAIASIYFPIDPLIQTSNVDSITKEEEAEQRILEEFESYTPDTLFGEDDIEAAVADEEEEKEEFQDQIFNPAMFWTPSGDRTGKF